MVEFSGIAAWCCTLRWPSLGIDSPFRALDSDQPTFDGGTLTEDGVPVGEEGSVNPEFLASSEESESESESESELELSESSDGYALCSRSTFDTY